MVLSRARSALAGALARAATALAPSSRYAAGFQGARSGHWDGDWIFGASSINSIIRTDADLLRDKARNVRMNTSTGERLPTLISENVSGKDGILYQAAVRGPDGEPDAETNRALEAAWYRWAEDPTAVSADRRLTWQEIEQLTDESEPTDGETILRLLPGFRNAWRFAVQVIDPDQLDLKYHVEARPGRNAIMMGVEIDEWGAPVAYHLWPNHPSEVQRRGDRIRVPAEQILHNFLTKRPGQLRGVTWFAPILADLMHLAKYREAEVVAARISAAKMGFIKGGANAGTQESISAEPGIFPKLAADEEVQFFDPNHPNGNYDAFDRAIIRSVSSAWRVSYMSASGDLSQTSFASGRMGWLGEKEFYKSLQERRILRYSRPVHRAWLPMAILSGQLDVRGTLGDLLASDWKARPFAPIDELKAENADALRLAMGKTSLTDLVEREGGDLRKVLEKRKAEIELAKQLGVPLYLPVGAAIPTTDDPEPQTSDQPATARGGQTPRSAIRMERVA